MRIAEQGYISVQPTYQHAGYTSALIPGEYLATRTFGAGYGGVGLSIILLVGGLMLWRRYRGALVPVVGASALCMTAVVEMLGSLLSIQRVVTLEPHYAKTLYNIEQASALTDRWTAELGHVPPVEEWSIRMDGRECSVDGWGMPLVYQVLDRPDVLDGMPYSIIGGLGRHGVGERDHDIIRWGIASGALGVDGVFGTPDDQGWFRHHVGDWRHPGQYEHGRTPRPKAQQPPAPAPSRG